MTYRGHRGKLRETAMGVRGRSHGGLATTVLGLVAACGGGGGGGDASGGRGAPTPEAPAAPLHRTSAETPFAVDCNGAQVGTLYANAEVEPFLVVNPASPANLIAIWQQDRWSNGAAQGLVVGASFDSGRSWTRGILPFSICAGGNSSQGGDFARASDPWLAVSPDGALHALGLAVTGAALTTDSESAMLIARSTDGGLSWSVPRALIRERGPAANDKGSITADSTDVRYVYAVWDRLDDRRGPVWLARTMDGGASWQPPRSIFDPGQHSQTIGNQIAVLPDGELVNFFTQIDVDAAGVASASLRLIRSMDRGDTWSSPLTVAVLLAIGAEDPDTGQPIRDGSILGSFATDSAGVLYVAWQDARFSNGVRDGVVLSRSSDRGLSWSAPVQVNANASVQAFLPTLHVRADGVIGVTYFDLRSNTPDAATLFTDHWLAISADGRTFTETRIGERFDLALAPVANGLFIGDYMGLASVDREFLALFVATERANVANRTDVYLTPITPSTSSFDGARAAARKPSMVDPAPDGAWRARIDRAVRLTMERRIPGWNALHAYPGS